MSCQRGVGGGGGVGVQQTSLDLMERGIDVHVIVDACSSRSMVDR